MPNDPSRSLPVLGIVVPCYNEECCIIFCIDQLLSVLNELTSKNLISPISFLCLVDDGSTDETWNAVEKHAINTARCRGIKLASNVGHQRALIAGMKECSSKVDCLITIDADLQDDIHAIEEMVIRYLEGCDIVYGVRNNRGTDSHFKRVSAACFYYIMDKLKTNNIPQHADFRLLSRRALQALENFEERNFYIRGIIASIGFPSATVYYSRNVRKYGCSKFNLRRMLSFAWQGITSFSNAPLRLAGYFSLTFMALSIVHVLYIFFGWIGGHTIPGWASLMTAVLLLGGIQLFCLAIIGEYLAKIYIETKKRPHYFIEKTIGF